MRFKTIIQSLAALTALMSVMSSAYAANSGFYIGIDGGRDVATIKENDNYFDDPLDVNNTYANHLDGFLWGAHTGYNLFLTQNFVLGAEVFWNQSNVSLGWQHTVDASNKQFEIHDSIGASVLPGWQLDSNNRLYVRLGWIQSEFDQKVNNALSYGPAFNNKRSDGFETGLGYLVTLANKWDLRMEYDHADYHLIRQYSGSDSYSYKPQSDRYTLGVDYNFDSAQIKLPDTLLLPISSWYTTIDMGYDEISSSYHYVSGGATSQQDHSLRGYTGGLHFGYDWQLGSSHAVVGAEIFGVTNSSKGEYTQIAAGSANTSTLREQYSYGASLLPGYQLNAANLLYTRVGVIESQFKKTITGSGLGPAFTATKTGLELGLGYQVAFNEDWSVLCEYDYADYKEIHTSDSTGTYNYDPEENLYKVGVSYHF